MTRSTSALVRRGLAVAALATLAATLTAGCGAGQQSQTATQLPAVPGANEGVDVGDNLGRLLVSNAVVSYARGGYAKGANAPLELLLSNETGQPVRLVEVEAKSPSGRVLLFTGASSTPAGTASASASPSATGSPSPTASRSPSPTGTRSPSPTANRSTTATATRSPSSAVPGSPAGSPVNIEIPAHGYVVLSPGAGRFLQIVGLSESLRLGQTVKLTFRFSNGKAIEDVSVPVNTPTAQAPRSPLVFTEGSGGHD